MFDKELIRTNGGISEFLPKLRKCHLAALGWVKSLIPLDFLMPKESGCLMVISPHC
jgi:hypothetical protein